MIISSAENEQSEKTYFSIKEAYEPAAQRVGLSQEGELWLIRTQETSVIGAIKNILKCDVVEGPSKSGEKPADDGSEGIS